MAHSFRNLILTLAVACTGFSLQAQNVSPVEPAPEITLKFSPASRDGVDPIVYRPAKGKALTPVEFDAGYRQALITYKGPEKLEFFAAASASEADARPVAICNVPKGVTQALLLFFARAETGADGIKYDVVAIDDNPEKVIPGSFAVINITKRNYAVEYGKGAPVKIGHGVSECYPATGEITLQLAMQYGEKWSKVGRRGVNMSKRNRVWVILYPPYAADDLDPIIQTIVQVLPAKDPTAPVASQTVARFP